MKTVFKIKKPTALLILLFCISSSLYAQTFTLPQILDSITVNNTGLQQFALQSKANYADADAAKGWMAPTVGVGVSEFPYGGSNANGGIMPRKMLMLRMQQMFPNFSKQNKEKEYQQSFEHQNKDDSATLKNMLFAKAKMAYYDAFVAEKKLAVLNQQEQQLKLLIKISEGRLEYNKADLPNIYKARAKLSDLQSMRIQLESITLQNAALINSLMNRPTNENLRIDTTQNIVQNSLQILQVDSAYVINNRSDIAHTTDVIHSLSLNKEIAATAAKPTFGIGWDNMRMNSGRYMFSAMATMSIPIAPWFSKGYKSKMKADDYRIEAMRKMQNNQVQTVLGNIRKDQVKLESSIQDLQIFQNEVIPAYTKTYQANLNAFSENTGSIYETLDAWNELTQKKMDYYQKLSDVLNIRVMLETEMQQD